MGRKRKEADKWMPAKTYRGKSAYEYRPTKGVCIRLCSLDSKKSVVIRRHADEYEKFHTNKGTVKELGDMFFQSVQFTDLKPNTRKDYEKHWKPLNAVFGKMDARKVKPEHVRKYMDIKGQTSQTQANRQHSLFSRIFSWGFERGHVPLNPCKGVAKFSEKARDRYIEDWEYEAVYHCASDPLKVAMEFSYLLAARKQDVLALTKDQFREEGIYIKQSKTDKEQIKVWTPRLEEAKRLSETLETNTATFYVVPQKSGQPYTSSGFDSLWAKARKEARKQTGKKLDFTFHDIKAKGVSDYEGDKQKFSGHKTASQVATYDRKIAVVEALNVPSISKPKNTK